MNESSRAALALRIGLSFVFTYAAIAGFLNPSAWVGFIPAFVERFIPEALFLTAFGIIELALATLLLFMRNPRYPALAAAALLLGMVVFNLGALDIVFRDIGLALAALALAAMPARGKAAPVLQ